MNKENINRLKKYLFLISLFFSIILSGHILYVYLYNDAIENPIEWWSISEWIIWDFPTLNPLLPSSDYNKNIIHQIYRSLIKYDFEEKKFVWDLADCDIKNLWYIECYLKDNIKWSNWTDITTKDIIATFNIIKNSDINPVINSLLNETTIEERNWIVIFSNKVKDVNFLNVLLQPIVSKEILDNIWNKELSWKFNPMDGLYSWKYKIDTVSFDDSLWIQRLILAKNENYDSNEILISKYIYKFFKDNSHFLKHKDTVNIFYDQNNIIWDSLLRLNKEAFYLNKYSAIFLNQDRVSNEDLRTFIFSKIDVENILKSLWKWFKEVKNPYLLSDISLNKEIKNSNLESIFKSFWYYKKDELTKIINDSLKSENEKIQKENEKKDEWKKSNETLSILSEPLNQRYNFISSDDVLLKWNISKKWVSEVYINDYKLSSFKSWDENFYYRLKESLNTIKEWVNTYKIEFVIDWKKEKIDEFYITFYKDSKKLEKIKNDFLVTSTWSTNSWTLSITNKSIEEKNKELEKISNLDDKYYYNEKLEKFNLRFYYLDNQKEFVQVSNIIKNVLETYWMSVETVPLSLSDINSKVINWEKDYDMILIWIDLWYFDFNIFPYFHSSQAKWWYNFSGKKDLNIDIVLEELKSSIFSKEKTIELEQKVLNILHEKQLVKTLYSKENVLLVDNNIKNFKLQETLVSTLWINEAIYKSFITADKELVLKNKWIFDFIKFIKNIFKNEWN